MVFKIFRRKKPEKEEEVEAAKLLGEVKGKFTVEEVFQLKLGLHYVLVLAGRVLRGELAVGDFLKLPDGRLLKVERIERKNRKVERAVVNEPVGVFVKGVGWKPGRKDLEKYRVFETIKKLREEAEKKYSHMPKELAKKLVEKEVRNKLREELEKISLEIYAAK
ncbi:MAG: hypothetical protein DRN04_14460 [Thermoprotei archaeon]|nr:MAG: hypothetical protein DRN04_14460 [Thermoprotei archaeon]